MRIRLPILGAFALLSLLLAYLGLAPLSLSSLPVSDKFLHFIAFLFLTPLFYFTIDTTRRRAFNLTLTICVLGLGIASEVVQGWIPNGRDFDVFDVAANLVGGGVGLGVSMWYHKRMLERKRRRRYTAVPQEGVPQEDVDVELGEGGLSRTEDGHEEGIITTTATTTPAQQGISGEEDLDGWDNDVQSWDEEDVSEGQEGTASAAVTAGQKKDDVKKHSD